VLVLLHLSSGALPFTLLELLPCRIR